LIILVAKIVAGIFIYYWLNIGSIGTFWSDPNRVFKWDQNAVFLQGINSGSRWPYLFLGWDSAWYLSIITHGYTFSIQTYTFSPGLPFLASIPTQIFGDPLASTAILSFVFGVLAIPLFQVIAEKHLTRKASFLVSLLFGFSPYLFLFSTVVYAEGMFLCLTLVSWYFLDKDRLALASTFAAIASLTRVMGLVMTVPMLYSIIRKREKVEVKKVVLSLTPFIAVGFWYLYCLLVGGDLFAPIHTTEWSGLTTIPKFLAQDLPQKGLQAFSEISLQNWPATQFMLLPLAVIISVIAPPFLINRLKPTETNLKLFSWAAYFGILLFGAIVSFPRFVSVLFPLWIPLARGFKIEKKEFLAITIMVAFFVIGTSMWISFLNGQFIS
jgi:hypothetical protein